jgi:hypothetical protein
LDTKQENMRSQEGRIVYVKSVNADELPNEVRDQIDGLTELYAVHSADGERLALVKDRNFAFVLARQNDMSPVAVH